MIRFTAQSAAQLVAAFLSASPEEAVVVLHLDGQGRLLATTFAEPGERDEVDLPVPEILAAALRIGAAAIMVAHNHPSGNPAPSEDDLRATRRLGEAAAAVGVKLADHLILAGEEWRSFRELGLL